MAADQSDDPRFIVFSAPEYGVRAIARIIKTYERKYGINTVRGLVNRWAPPSENNSDAYAQHVAQLLGVNPDMQLTLTDHLQLIVKAIIHHENGQQPYSDEVINDGIAMA
ncbi:MAG: hypothetical protein OIF57_11980 [Marinobacterium sp.]|nr:hypothetical protein [Marinobacterium sp.]